MTTQNKSSEKTRFTYGLILIIGLAIISIILGYLYFRYPDPSADRKPQSTAVITSPSMSPPKNPWGQSTVNLAWFTYIPRSEDLLTVASNFHLFILIQGNETERDRMIDLGANGPVLQYLNFRAIQDPGSCISDPELNQVTYLAGDFCKINEQYPDWFLRNPNGDRFPLSDKDNRWYLMDPGNKEWQEFFLQRIEMNHINDPNWSGVFLDNVPLTLSFLDAKNNLPQKYPTDGSFQIAVQDFLKYIYEGYFKPNGKLLIGNLSSRKDDSDWVRHLAYLDGAMLEGWAIDWPDGYRSAERWEQHMLLAEQTQQMGKFIILVSRGHQDNYELQQFSFASYLLINQGLAYFRYAHGDSYRDPWLYDNYQYHLGSPLGPRYNDGETWKRDFSNGSVSVNPDTHEVTINLR